MPVDTEWAWASGFCEGEASIIARRFARAPNTLPRLQMIVPQIHRGPLDRLEILFECGKVNGPYVYNGNKPIWKYQAAGDDLIWVLEHLRPYGSGWFQEKIDRALNKRKGFAA